MKVATQNTPAAPLAVEGALTAPVVHFEGAPTAAFNNGVVTILLATCVHVSRTNGEPVSGWMATAHLKGGVHAAIALRDALDKALLLAAPAGGQVS